MRIIFTLILIFSTLFTLSSCGGKDEPERDFTPYFRAEEFTAPDDVILGSNLRVSGGDLLIEAFTKETFTDENGRTDRKRLTLRVDSEGNVSTESNDSPERTLGVFTAAGDRFEVMAVIGEASFESVTIRRFHGDKLKETLDASEIFGVDISKLKPNLAGEGGFSMLAVGEHDGQLVFVSNLGVSVSGRIYSSRDELTSAVFAGKRLLLISKKNDRMTASEFDFSSFETSGIAFPDGFVSDFRFEPLALEGYDIAAKKSDGIYGMNFDESGNLVPELIFDFVGSDISGSSLGSVAAVSASEFWFFEYDYTKSYGDPGWKTLWKADAIPADEYVPRSEIRVLCLGGASQTFERQVVTFNRRSESVRIALDTRVLGENEDLNAFRTRIAAELAGGNIPDGVYVSVNFGVDPAVYARQGLFTDLYKLMDDAGYDRSELLDCQTKSFTSKRGGAEYLPYVALSGGFSMVVTEKKDFDGTMTLDVILDLIESGRSPYKPRWNRPFSSDQLIDGILPESLDVFLKEGFDGDLFRRFVKVCREMSLDDETPLGKEVFCVKFDRPFGQDFLNLKSDFEDYHIAGAGVVFEPYEYFGVTDKSEYKPELFGFLESIFDGSQNPFLTKRGLDAAIDSLDRYHAVYGRSYAHSSEPFGDERKADFAKNGSVLYFEADETFAADIKEIIKRARAKSQKTADIISIVREEIGDKNHDIDTVCGFIEDRVSTYVSEKG